MTQQTQALSERPLTSIEILALKPCKKPGAIKGFVSLRIGGMTLHDCKVVQQPGQHPWVAMPASSWTGADGKTRWKVLVELDAPLKDRVSAAVLAQWSER